MESRETRVDNIPTNYSTKSNRSILVDLAQYDQFSDDIKLRANNIYIKMYKATRRANKRPLLLFFCVYNAYKELGIKVNPDDLGDIFNLKPGQLQKTESMFSPLQTGYKPIPYQITIEDYIIFYTNDIHLNDHGDSILKLYQKITNNELMQSAPQSVAAGIIKYYMIINGIELGEKNLLSQVTRRSDTTIDAMYKKICEIDNC